MWQSIKTLSVESEQEVGVARCEQEKGKDPGEIRALESGRPLLIVLR